MKNWAKKAIFSFHIAWRNMRFHPFRTILLMIGFLGVSMTVILTITMTDIFHTYFYGDLADMYQDIDLKITVNDGSQTRFFSTTPLTSSDIDDVADGIYPFFEYDALIEVTEDDRDYAHVFASSTEMLGHLSDDASILTSTLTDDEVIVTKSYAFNHSLDIGDAITLTIGDQTKQFYIVDILADGKLFYGESIFIDKQASLSFFLTALDPDLATLPTILLRNIYNALYVDITEETSFDDAVTAFKTISGYQTLDYIKTIDDVEINTLVERNTSLLSGLISFVFVAIMLVLQTTLRFYFHERKRQATTIHILGGRSRYALSILGFELLIEQVLAFVLAILLTNASIRFGMNYLDSAWIYELTPVKIIMAFSITLAIFIGMFVYYSIKSRTMSDMHEMRLGGDEKSFGWRIQLIVTVSSLVIYGFLYIGPIADLLGHSASIIRVALSAIFLLFAAPLVFYLVMLWSKKFKEKRKLYYHLRILAGKKGFSHYFSVTLIVSLVIFLLIFMMQHLDHRIETIASEYQFDLIVTRMLQDQNQIRQDIASLDTVDAVDRADVYESVEIPDRNISISYVISMDTSALETYFNLKDLDDAIVQLDSYSEPAMILPRSYHEVYRYEVNDTLQLTVNPDQPDQMFKVAGFFEKQGFGVAFTNLYMIDQNTRTDANSMLVKADGNRIMLKNQLLDAYSHQMIIIFDFQSDYIEPFVFQMVRIKNFIIGYLSLVMICFIMTLANHQTLMQIEREADDARMLAIGYQVKDMQKETIFEGVIILAVSLIVSIVSYSLIVGQIEGMFIVFGAYEEVLFKPISIWIGSGINIVLFSIMWITRLKRQPNVRLIDYIRTY